MAENPKQTILEDGTEFDGVVKSRCPITVSGKLKGEVAAPSLTITPSGAVQGQVKVSQLKSQGELSGDIEADSVELSGKVNDNTTIRAASLEVVLSQTAGKLQVTFGNCELQVGDKVVKAAEPAKPVVTPAPPPASAPPRQETPVAKVDPKPNK
jgi:cytoskeletal protein CcmA (bactofilin family)